MALLSVQVNANSHWQNNLIQKYTIQFVAVCSTVKLTGVQPKNYFTAEHM